MCRSMADIQSTASEIRRGKKKDRRRRKEITGQKYNGLPYSIGRPQKRVKSLRLDVAKFSFSNRVVNEWNILDEEIISGSSLAGLKWKLDRHLRDKRGYI